MHSTIDPPLEHLIGQMITTTVNLFSQRYREEKSLRHVAMIPKFLDFNKPWSYQYGRKKNENNDMYDFPVQDCTQEQNGSQCSTMQMAVSVKKEIFYYGNVTSHSSLFQWLQHCHWKTRTEV